MPKSDLPAPILHKPKKKPPVAILEMLRVLLKHVADEENIAPRLIASADDLERLASDDEAPIRTLAGWRREIFGATALKLKNGKIALAVRQGRIRLITEIDPTL